MKVEEIERLLAEFYEGNTTESQEEILKDYFRHGEVPPHLQKEKELFSSLFCSPSAVDDTLPQALEGKLSRLIDEKAAEEQRFFLPNKSRRNWRWIGGIAATVFLLLGIGYSIGNFGRDMCPPTPQDTFSDPRVAYEVLQATLMEVSVNLNKGIEQVAETQEDVTRINKELIKEIKR